MPIPKIDKSQLNSMLREGRSQKECAEFFKVSESAISMCKKSLKTSIVRTVCMDQAHEIITADLNLMKNLKFIMEAILNELKEVQKELHEGDGSKAQLRESLVSLVAESRKQLNLLREISESWFDHEGSVRFREEVLDTIEQFEPGSREKILLALKQRKTIRGIVRLPG